MSVEIIQKNQVPVLNIDGKETPLVCFFGNHSDVGPEGRQNTVETVKMSADVADVHIHSINMRLPWNHPECGPDYVESDRIINSLLEQDPETKLIIRFHCYPVTKFEDGRHNALDAPTVFGDEYEGQYLVSNKGGTHNISIASEIWVRELEANVTRFVKHLRAQPYCESILAIHPDCHEWFSAMEGDCVGDFSDPMRTKWREYVKEAYADSDELALQWGGGFSFDNIEIPTLEDRRTADGASILDPRESRRIHDFYKFSNELVADVIIRIAKVIKTASQNRYLSLFFYGYLFEITNNFKHGTQQSGHCALRKILESKYMDMLSGPISYFERWGKAEDGGSYFMTPVDSVLANGKIWIQEDDARTFLKTKEHDGLKPAANLKNTISIARKNMSNSIVHNCGTWFMDLPAQGWLKDRRIWEEVSTLNRIYRALYEQNKLEPFHSEVAVIVDEKSTYAMDASNALMHSLVYRNRYFLSRMGVICGYYLLSDLVQGKVPEAKLYVFLNAVDVRAEERDYIDRNLKQRNCTLLWLYAPGFADGIRLSCEGIQGLTGFEVLQFGNPEKAGIRIIENGPPNLLADMKGEAIAGKLDAYYPGPDCSQDEVFPLFHLSNDDEALGVYESSQKGAIGLKQTGRANSCFYGSPVLNTGFLIRLAKFSGVHLYNETGHDFIFDNRHYLAISSEVKGEKTLRLPRRSDVHDLTNSTLVGREIKQFGIEMGQHETNIYGIDFSL